MKKVRRYGPKATWPPRRPARKSFEETVKPGNQVQIYYSDDDPHNRIIHVRAIVDDKVVIFASWDGKEYQYEIEHIKIARWKYQAGFYIFVRKTPSSMLPVITNAET
jgi:hypothetical protein